MDTGQRNEGFNVLLYIIRRTFGFTRGRRHDLVQTDSSAVHEQAKLVRAVGEITTRPTAGGH
jgi:hypothetical protein